MELAAETREAARQHASRALHLDPIGDGTVRIRGRLIAEVGGLLVNALAAARETLYSPRQAREPDPSTAEQYQADALALLAETALNHGLDPGAPAEHEQAVVHVDAEVLADPTPPRQSVFENGTHVPAGTSQRLACDASRVVIRHDPRRAGGRGRRPHAHGAARATRPPSPERATAAIETSFTRRSRGR